MDMRAHQRFPEAFEDLAEKVSRLIPIHVKEKENSDQLLVGRALVSWKPRLEVYINTYEF